MRLSDVLMLLADAADWLLQPIGGSGVHQVTPGIAWHGRLMSLAWLVLAPLSILIARFYKVTAKQDWPRKLDNPFWFIMHRRLGYAVAAVMVIALGNVWWSNGFAFRWSSLHAFGGWTLLLLGGVQIVSALFRGTHGGPIHPMTRKAISPEHWHGDHYSMTLRRIVFEYAHKIFGYALVPFIVLAILSGLSAADAPRWMWGAVLGSCLAFLWAFVRLQRQGRCIDTYQAIWGVDRALPGNQRRKAIGLGIRRYTQDNVDNAIWPKR